VLSRTLHRRGTITGLQLGVDVPDVRPRGQGNPVLTSPVVIQTAAPLGITPAQVALLWLLQLAPNVPRCATRPPAISLRRRTHRCCSSITTGTRRT